MSKIQILRQWLFLVKFNMKYFNAWDDDLVHVLSKVDNIYIWNVQLLFRLSKSLGFDSMFVNNNICVLLRLSGKLIMKMSVFYHLYSLIDLLSISQHFSLHFHPLPFSSETRALHVSKASAMQVLDCLWRWCSVPTNARHGPKQRDRINQNPGEAGLISWLKPKKKWVPQQHI
jgi:hypothetical protein